MITQNTSRNKSQHEKILDYLKQNGSATIRELFLFCNINSPSKRLSELRELGLIETVRCTKTNAAGETKRFCRYYLRKEMTNE